MLETYSSWFIVTLIFIIIDVITGVLKAAENKDLNSTTMRKGIYHKAAYLLIILLASVCQISLLYFNINIDLPLIEPTCSYIIFCELMSILENIGEMNPTLKSFIEKFMNTKK